MTPTQRSMELCKENGWLCEVVERWIPGTRIRKDLFGFIDAIALIDGKIVGLQITSRSNVSARVKKITLDRADQLRAWLDAGGTVEVWGWGKMKRKDKSGRSWQIRRIPIA